MKLVIIENVLKFEIETIYLGRLARIVEEESVECLFQIKSKNRFIST